MASVQLPSTINMDNLSGWYATVTAKGADDIVISNGPLVGTYTGSFTYDAFGNVSGTLTGFNETSGGQTLISASGLDVSAGIAFQLISWNQIQAFLQIALVGTDQFTVSPGMHVIDGYGGYNTVNEPDFYSLYTLSSSGSSTTVNSSSSHDTLINIQAINFADGFYDTQTDTFSPSVAAPPPPATSFNVPDPSDASSTTALPTETSFNVLDLSNGQSTTAGGSTFTDLTPDNLIITANGPNVFIVSGTGSDILSADQGGNNVLDDTGGAVNFEIGGSGNDAFFFDASKDAVSWNTIANFHAGDFAVIYGIAPQDVAADAADGLGAAGYNGLTLETFQNGGAAFITFAGHQTSELGSSLLTGFGTDPSGHQFMLVVGT